ncbi:ketosteroid isomerase-like protein/quercetin dioxygenase-like cupin family protein [Lipingzhangella halophila]|uniref:Ketosteroid isomerase-like protein/quercetin dioxygenase-like cupin family protein n=1 Tax=Lipingzhangella halophila TaxID=1783352 RepID=A0A7W7W3E9_9ACTN|nr:nuclear transport factor 2 family protein [Lipingzhangella halophila]MBB4932443.1 ketosteroid isomerase-like protein/quercetin dioxygenase-like cupin family protein [Lipingzhangella halophila]
MSIKEETPHRFNAGELRHALEDKDLDAMLGLFTNDAEYRIVSKSSPPSSPHVLRGRDQIGEFIRDVFSRDLNHELKNVVVEGDHVAYEDLCTYGDGTRVIGVCMADLDNGRISRVTDVESWDEESAKTEPSEAQSGDFSAPGETRTFDHGRLDLVHIGGGSVGRFQLEPGWQWSTHIKPMVGTELCQSEHFAYHISGTLHVRMADGSEFTLGPGQVAHIPPGHDAWVEGDEAVVILDWTGAKHYAQR